MAYTYTMDTAAPAGSVDANTLDSIIQDLKKMYNERLESKLIVSAIADPWVLLAAITGEVTGLEYNIPAASFQAASPGAYAPPAFSGGQVTGSALYVAAIELPIGVTITGMKVFTRNNTGVAGSCSIYGAFTTDTGASSVGTIQTGSTLATASNANGLYNLYTVAGLSIGILSGWYWIGYTSGGTAERLRGVTLTYDSSSHLIRR